MSSAAGTVEARTTPRWARVRRIFRRLPLLRALYDQAKCLPWVGRELVSPEWAQNWAHLKREYDFEIPIERERHSRTLSAVARRLGPKEWGDVLEVGCSEGVFTVELASRCRSVTACDISAVACGRAAERCAGHANVRIERWDIVRAPVPTQFDQVFAMDILDCVHGRRRLRRLVAKLAKLVRPHGLLVVSLCHLPPPLQRTRWARWLLQGRDHRLDVVNRHPGLRLVHSEFYPDPDKRVTWYLDHVIAIFEKVGVS